MLVDIPRLRRLEGLWHLDSLQFEGVALLYSYAIQKYAHAVVREPEDTTLTATVSLPPVFACYV